MASVVRRARSPFALSLVFGLSLVSIFVVSQSVVSSQRLTSQAIADHRRSPSSFIQKQNESSTARDERRRATREFDLLKRAPSVASEISDASYQSARDRLCHLLEMTARLD